MSTRSASATARSSPVTCATSSKPGTSVAPQTRRAAPIPPAAPAPGRSATWRPVRREGVGPPGHPVLEVRDLGGGRALLRAEDPGRARRARAAGWSRRRGRRRGRGPGSVVRVQGREPPQRVLRVGGDVGAEGAQHPGPAVGAGAAAQPDEHPSRAARPGRARGVLPARPTTRSVAPRSPPCRAAPDRWCGPPRRRRSRPGARGTPRRAVGRGRRPWTPAPTSTAAPPPGRRWCPRHRRRPPRPAPTRTGPRTGHRGGPPRRRPGCPAIP